MKKVLFVLAIAACTVACAKKAENKACEEQKPACEKVEAAPAQEADPTLKEVAEDVAKDLLKVGGDKAAEEIKK